jgi:hypothetical protein
MTRFGAVGLGLALLLGMATLATADVKAREKDVSVTGEVIDTPICQPVTEPVNDPTGRSIKHTAHLYVLVPMFSVDNDQNPADAMPCPDGGRPPRPTARIESDAVPLLAIRGGRWQRRFEAP